MKNISLSPLRITLIYLVVAALWIAFTDQILNVLISDAQYLSTLQTYKGWFYVAVTSLGLFYLIKRFDRQISYKDQELKSEQELFDTLFDRIPVMVAIYDPKMEEIEINREFEKTTGWKNEAIKKVNLLEVLYPELDVREKAVEFMNQPGSGWKEFPIETKSGEIIPTSWTNIKLTDDTLVGIGIDMSQIKASETKIRESRALLRKTIESLQESVILLDPESRTIIDCNQKTEEMFGYSYDELIGSSTKKLHISKEKFSEFNEQSLPALENHDVFQTEFEMQRKDGTPFYSDHTVTFVRNKDSSIDKIVSVVRDITDQKEYRKKLEERNTFIEKTIDNLPIGVAVNMIDNRKATFMNKKFAEIYGWPQEVLRDVDTFFEKIYPDEEYRAKVTQQITEDIESGDPERMQWNEIKITTREGEERIVNAKNIPLYDQNLMISTVLDVTEQSRLEDELKVQNRKLERAQKEAGIGYWEMDLTENGNPVWSDNLYNIYGLNKDEYSPTNDDFLERVHPEDRRPFEILKNEIIEKGSVAEKFRLIKPNGEVGFYQARNELLTDENGEPSKILGIIQNITELKQAEEKLKKEKQRFQLVAKTSSDVIWDLDFIAEELWWSEDFEETFGYKRGEPAENYKKWAEYIHPEDREMISKSSDQALNSDAGEWKEEYRLVKEDGSTAYMIDRAVIIRDNEGNAVRMVGTMDDITEQKLAEMKLRESEEKYRHLFENNPEPMWIYKPDTLKFVEVNQAAIEHYGYSEEEFLNMDLLDIRPDEDAEALKKNVAQNKGRKSYSEEWTHFKKDGSLIKVELSAADLQYQGERHRLVLVNDVTEQRRVQEKIIQSVIEGEDRERKRIAHELHDGLGQYLVAASMNLQSAKTDADQLPKKRQNQLETGLSLLKNALSETRSIAYNLMPKAIADYGLITALENLVKDFEKSTNIEFEFDHNCDNLDLNSQTEINIYRIFQEITSNAIRHADCSRITMKLQLKEDTLTIVIQDDGIGVELSEQDEGNGLGLQSIQSRVNNLRGAIDIDSEPGRGMKITITIPNIQNLNSNHTT